METYFGLFAKISFVDELVFISVLLSQNCRPHAVFYQI